MRPIPRVLGAGIVAIAAAALSATGVTTAAFTDTVPGGTASVRTATLSTPQLRIADRSVIAQLSWDAIETTGAQPEYTLIRTSDSDPTPVTVYQGARAAYVDAGNLPREIRTVAFTHVDAGNTHTVAVAADGSAWAWGSNGSGQLGDGTRAARTAPVPVAALPDERTITAVSAGESHTAAVASDGTVWSWGSGQSQSGDPTRPARVALPDGRAATSVSAGQNFTVVLASDGTAWSWGSDADGRLGNGPGAGSSVPVQVVPLPDGRSFTSVSAGRAQVVATASDGSAWAWGFNGDGALGDGTTTSRDAPVPVTGLPDTVASVSAGDSHTIAILDDGTAWAWGKNADGQLGAGDGVGASSPRPVPVVPLPDGQVLTRVSAGFTHNIAIASDLTTWVWGDGGGGALGTGSSERRSRPTRVDAAPAGSALTGVSAGQHYTALTTADQGAWAWGRNTSGQLGNGTATGSRFPVRVTDATAAVCPPGSVPVVGPSVCSLRAGDGYSYRLFVTVGAWTANPTEASVSPR